MVKPVGQGTLSTLFAVWVSPEGVLWATQPRRISAITIPEYISSERGQELGGETGFQIRFVNMVCVRAMCVCACACV